MNIKIIMLLSAVVYINGCSEFIDGVRDDYLESVAVGAKEELKPPVMVDAETRLDDVAGGEGRLNYSYTLVNYNAEDLNLYIFKNNIKTALMSSTCDDTGSKMFMLMGTELVYSYKDKQGELLADIKLTHQDCKDSARNRS